MISFISIVEEAVRTKSQRTQKKKKKNKQTNQKRKKVRKKKPKKKKKKKKKKNPQITKGEAATHRNQRANPSDGRRLSHPQPL